MLQPCRIKYFVIATPLLAVDEEVEDEDCWSRFLHATCRGHSMSSGAVRETKGPRDNQQTVVGVFFRAEYKPRGYYLEL